MKENALDDPYRVPGGTQDDAEIPLRHWFLAIGLGLATAIAVAVTMSAFLFGLLVAAGGQFRSAPVNLQAVISQGAGRWLLTGGVLFIFVCSAGLGYYTTVNRFRAAGKSLLVEYRRRQLKEAVREYRQRPKSEPEDGTS